MKYRVHSLAQAAVLLALFPIFTANAQDQPKPVAPSEPCPINFSEINPTGSEALGGFGSESGHRTYGRLFVLKVRNTSGKDIRGMKFQAAYLDATEDVNAIPVAWNWTNPVKAGDEKTFRWANNWNDKAAVGWNVALEKVLYEDGSVWEQSASQKCQGEYRRHKR